MVRIILLKKRQKVLSFPLITCKLLWWTGFVDVHEEVFVSLLVCIYKAARAKMFLVTYMPAWHVWRRDETRFLLCRGDRTGRWSPGCVRHGLTAKLKDKGLQRKRQGSFPTASAVGIVRKRVAVTWNFWGEIGIVLESLGVGRRTP